MKKRFLHISLAAILLITALMPCSAFAQGFAEFMIKGETSSARPGDQIKIIVSLEGEPVRSVDASIVYDADFFEYVEGSASYNKTVAANSSHAKINAPSKGKLTLFVQSEDSIPTDGTPLLTFELLVKGKSGQSGEITGQSVLCVGANGSATARIHPVSITASSSAAKRTETPVRTPTPFDSFAPPPYTPGVTPTATAKVTAKPTKAPEKTAQPTEAPTQKPTEAPTVAPTVLPTVSPTVAPTVSPTAAPTQKPTAEPTQVPATAPTEEPKITLQPVSTPESEPEKSDEPAFIVPDDGSNGLTGAQEIMIIVIAAICGIAFIVMLLLFLRVRKMR
ncbi:MAG: hypothetical protein IJF16_06555 [Clostridia bacterium]|nr:hypothetical protein [Clostridia bacterium]